MAIAIHDVRMAVIWPEIMTELLQIPSPETEFRFLNKRWRYEGRFDQLQKSSASDSLDLTRPWPPGKEGQRFWTFYLEKKLLAGITGKIAWRNLVPFQRCVAAKIAPPVTARYSFYAFYYPFGVSLFAKFRLSGAMTLDEAVASCQALRKGTYEMGGDQLSLNQVADRLLQQIREEVFGGKPSGSIRDPDPLTVVTVVKGTGADTAGKPPLRKDVHRALHALTDWKPVDARPLAPLLDFDRKSPDSSRVLYCQRHARAVWYPDLFTIVDPKHTLACYHYNLALGSQQVEMLGGLVRYTAGLLGAGKPLASETHVSCARYAVGVLGRIDGGKESTYRSKSLAHQVSENGLAGDMQTLREKLPPD